MKITFDFFRSHSKFVLMNSRAILGLSLATVFAFAMMSNPIFAVSPI